MAKPPDPFHEFVAELFEPLGPIHIRRMFGGAGVYAHGVMFALLAEEQIFIKVDETLREQLEEEDSPPFRFKKKDGSLAEMGYLLLPDAALDDSGDASDWARKALDVALKAKATKVRKKKRIGKD